MARKKKNYTEILAMGEQYGVTQMPLWQSLCDRYKRSEKLLNNLHDAVDRDGEVIAKGDTIIAHPAIPQITKVAEVMNKTAGQMLEIINKLGHEKTVNRFQEMEDDLE